jgi:drug/metabolite transporter (DMT)-like permease
MGLRTYGARPIDAAMMEAAIPGLILVYLFTRQQRLTWGAWCIAAMVLLGLTVFLGLFTHMGAQTAEMTAGSWVLLASAILTSVGLICDDRMAWPMEPPAKHDWRWRGVTKTSVSKSLRKTLFGSLLSGLLTLMFIPVCNLLLGTHAAQVLTVPASAWPGVVILALVGTCITWFAIFLLIQMQQMLLIVALVAGIPVVSAAYNYLSGRAEAPLQSYEWFGGAILLVSLGAMVYMQLMRSSPGEQPPTQAVQDATLPDPFCPRLKANATS